MATPAGGQNLLTPLNSFMKIWALLPTSYSSGIKKVWSSQSGSSIWVVATASLSTSCLKRDTSAQGMISEPERSGVSSRYDAIVFAYHIIDYSDLPHDTWFFLLFSQKSEGAVLEVSTVTPSPDNLDQFSNFDWIIGNHSDELTPWMPVLARRSNAKLFLLPCCPFEFYGKLRRSKSGSKSHYR